MANAATPVVTPVQRLKGIINSASVQEQFKNALKEGASLFVSSLIDIYSNDKYLQKCPPQAVVIEALKAATLKLPINKSLGFAYIVPYKDVPSFQIGYKGYIQLAMRTAQYKFINADCVYEGELKSRNKITGEIDLSGEAKSGKVVGYFAYIETINGFKKGVYWSTDKIIAHAKRYSKSYGNDKSAWKTNFDEMALKTMLRNVLNHYGVMSVEMMNAFASDADDRTAEAQAEDQIREHANTELIDVDPETGEIMSNANASPEPPQLEPAADPGF